jgi:dihydroorotase
MMLNRRRFVGVAAAGAAIFTRIPNALAATYDLLIKGGRVIDPSLGIDAVRDVAVAGDRVAAIEETIAPDSAADVIDARGKIVAPGLVDIHTHAARSKDGPPLALLDGVTGWDRSVPTA